MNIQSESNQLFSILKSLAKSVTSVPTLLVTRLLLAAGSAQSATYYYDNDSSNPGFGTAGGIWAAPTAGPIPGWTTNDTGASVPLSVTTSNGDTLNFGNGALGLGAGTITVSNTVSASNMTFASGSGAILLTGGTISLAATEIITVDNTSNTISSILAGAATSLTKAGAGKVTLTSNSGVGTVVVTNGTLRLEGGTLSTTNQINNLGIKLVTGTLEVAGGNINVGTYALGSYTGNSGTLNVTAGNVNVAGALIVGWNSSPTFTVSGGAVTNSSIYHQDSAAGTLSISGSGVVTAGNVYHNSNGTGTDSLTLNLNPGGTLMANSLYMTLGVNAQTNGTHSFNVNFNGGTLKAGATGTLISTNPPVVSSTRAINVTVNSSGAVIDTNGKNADILQPLLHGSGSPDGGLTKLGAGNLALYCTNTFNGATTVSNGTLLVNAPGSLVSDVTVANGATLSGNGAIAGAVTMAAGANLAPGASAGAIGMLSLSNTLTLNGAKLYFDINSTNTPGTTYDQIANTGSLVLNGTNTVYLNGMAEGTYWLITCSGLPSGSGSVVFSNGSTNLNSATLAVVDGGIMMTVTNSPGGIDIWKGNVSTAWDGGVLNWTRNAVASTFADGDDVVFNDSATSFTVSSSSNVLPSSVAVSNTTAYTITATIGGATPLVKSGSGTLDLRVANNTYTGDTTINGGTLFIGGTGTGDNVGGTLGNGTYAGNIYIAGSALLSVRSTASQNYSGVISGNGSLFVGGGGVLTLSGSNTFTGPVQVAPTGNGVHGQLTVSSFNSVSNNATLGTVHSASSSLGAPTNVVNGTITLGQAVSGNVLLTYKGSGETTDRTLSFVNINNSARNMTLDNSGSGLLKFTTTPVGATLQCSLVLQGSSNGELVGGLPFSFPNLTKSGNGTWTLDGLVGITGSTTISQGTLELGGAGALANGTYAGTIANSGTLHYNSTATQTLSGVISGTGALIKNNTGTLTLSGANSYTGATTISNGTLLVNGSLTNASRVTVMSGGTLGGTGTVGIVTNSGTLSPGGAVMGTLTTSNLVLNAGCTSVFDLSGTNANDSVAVKGNLTFSGVPAVTVNMSPVVYGTYPLFSVYGSYPTNTVPSLNFVSSKGGVTSKLGWGSLNGTNTLSVTLSASGTLLMIK